MSFNNNIKIILTLAAIFRFMLVGTVFGADNYGSYNTTPATIQTLSDLEVALGKDSSFRSLDDLITSLPKPLLANPVFLYRSRSIQGASPLFPRTIVAEPNGNLVLSFNGHRDQQGYERLEMMVFHPQAEFTLHEGTIDQAGHFKISAANPPQCLSCHRSKDVRPNWETYDFWPGAYGSSDDRLSAGEKTNFSDFLRTALTHPRYSALDLQPLFAPAESASYVGRLPKEPNITLTATLARNNFKRVARLISQTPDYQTYKFVIVASLDNAGVRAGELREYVPDTHRGLFNYFSPKDQEEAIRVTTSVASAAAVSSTLAFRSLFESRGIAVSDWFMNFKGGLDNSFTNGRPWRGQLLAALIERDPELGMFIASPATMQLDTVGLFDASEKAFAKNPTPPSFRKFASDPDVAERTWQTSCQQCHESVSVRAPQFSWHEARTNKKFKRLIESGSMPKDQKLTPTQIQILLNAAKR